MTYFYAKFNWKNHVVQYILKFCLNIYTQLQRYLDRFGPFLTLSVRNEPNRVTNFLYSDVRRELLEIAGVSEHDWTAVLIQVLTL